MTSWSQPDNFKAWVYVHVACVMAINRMEAGQFYEPSDDADGATDSIQDLYDIYVIIRGRRHDRTGVPASKSLLLD